MCEHVRGGSSALNAHLSVCHEECSAADVRHMHDFGADMLPLLRVPRYTGALWSMELQ